MRAMIVLSLRFTKESRGAATCDGDTGLAGSRLSRRINPARAYLAALKVMNRAS